MNDEIDAERSYRIRRSGLMIRLMAAIGLVLVLVGCVSENGPGNDTALDVFSGLGEGDLSARYHPRGAYGPGGSSNPQSGARYSGGAWRSGAARAGGRQAAGAYPDGDGYRLNFEESDVASISQNVLGDILERNFTIDPRVADARVTLSSARPIPKGELLAVVETAFKSANVLIVTEGGLLRIVPTSEAAGAGSIEFGLASEGFGTTVIPVQYASVEAVAKVMQSFASRPGAITSDKGTNLIMVQGTADERAAAVQAAQIVDSKLMRSWSVGIFPLENATPEAMIAELTNVLDADGGGTREGQMRFQTMERMNAVLAVARTDRLIEMVHGWIDRLDVQDANATRAKSYRLKYARASNVAKILNSIFGDGPLSEGDRDQDMLQPSRSADSLLAAGGGRGEGSPDGTDTELPSGTADQDGERANVSVTLTGSAGKIRIAADPTSNMLMIFARPADYQTVVAAIRELDLPPVQVAIETTIAEVTLTNQLQYGVEAYLQSADINLGANKGIAGFTSSAISTAVNAAVPGANLILGSEATPRLVLHALHTLTSVRILSSPSLIVMDNEAASLQVGDQVAVKTQATQSTANAAAPIINNIEYRDTGIILNVTPHVNANGIVTLDVDQEISNVISRNGNSDQLTPSFSRRRVKSSIAVSSGQTVLLAGLISDRSNEEKDGLPGPRAWTWLTDIFSNKETSASRNELLIFIKPTILRDQVDAQATSEEFRDRMSILMRNSSQ